jgi:hypothetical protein
MNHNLWAIFPSGNSTQAQTCTNAWRDAGYRVAVLIDEGQSSVDCDHLIIEANYTGTASSLNRLASHCWQQGADAVACVNDDMFPGSGAEAANVSHVITQFMPDLLGVIHSLGDYYDALAWCCPHPIIGREYGLKANQGLGIFWPQYFHLFCDQELKDVATKYGLLHQTPSITIEHRHYSRGHADNLPSEKRERTNQRHAADRKLYELRKSACFPGSEFLP